MYSTRVEYCHVSLAYAYLIYPVFAFVSVDHLDCQRRIAGSPADLSLFSYTLLT